MESNSNQSAPDTGKIKFTYVGWLLLAVGTVFFGVAIIMWMVNPAMSPHTERVMGGIVSVIALGLASLAFPNSVLWKG